MEETTWSKLLAPSESKKLCNSPFAGGAWHNDTAAQLVIITFNKEVIFLPLRVCLWAGWFKK